MTTREVSLSSEVYFSCGIYSLHFLCCWQHLLSLNVENSPSWWSYARLPLKTVTPALKETFISFCHHDANIGAQMKKKMAHVLLRGKGALGHFPVDEEGCRTRLSQLESWFTACWVTNYAFWWISPELRMYHSCCIHSFQNHLPWFQKMVDIARCLYNSESVKINLVSCSDIWDHFNIIIQMLMVTLTLSMLAYKSVKQDVLVAFN